MEQQIIEWIKQDGARLDALMLARRFNLDDWCLAAGFVRNLVWDKLHDYSAPTPLNDIDLVYFNGDDLRAETDRCLESALNARSLQRWSVKNQARMHRRNNDEPYVSTLDALSRWPEKETAVGARLDTAGDIQVVAPFGLKSLLCGKLTPNPNCRSIRAYQERLSKKQWLRHWPKLIVS